MPPICCTATTAIVALPSHAVDVYHVLTKNQQAHPVLHGFYDSFSSALDSGREVDDGEFHLAHVKHDRNSFVLPPTRPVEAATGVVALQRPGWNSHRLVGCNVKRCDATPYSGDRRVDEGLDLIFGIRHKAHHSERRVVVVVVLLLDSCRNEERNELLQLPDTRHHGGSQEIVRDGWNHDSPVVQGVVDHKVLEGMPGVGLAPVEEEAAVAGVSDVPVLGRAVAGVVDEEGAGEVGGSCECGSGRRRAAWWLGGAESGWSGGADGTADEYPDDRWAVEGPEAAEEAVAGDEVAEGSAGCRGAHEVGRVVEAEEDLLQEINGELRLACLHRGHRARAWWSEFVMNGINQLGE